MGILRASATCSLTVVGIVGALSALYLFSYPNNLLPSGDSSEYWNNAYRVVRGERPYLDFWLLFPPGEAYFPAAVYALFGLKTTALPITLKALGVLAVVLSVLAARQFAGVVMALWVAFMVFARYDLYDHVYLVPILGAFLLLLFSFDSQKYWPSALAGFLTGVAFQLRFETAAVFAVGAAIALVVSRGGPSVAWRARLDTAFAFVLAFVLVVALEFSVFSDAPFLFFKAVFVDSVRHGTSMNLPFFVEVRSRSLLDAAPMLLRLLLPFLLGGAAIYYLGSRRLKTRDAAICVLLLIWMVGVFPKALGRSDAHHFVHAWFPAYLLLAFLQSRTNAIAKDRIVRLSWMSGITALALVLLADDARFKRASWQYLHSPYYRLQTPMGTVTALDKASAKSVRRLVAEIEHATDVGEPIFVIPWYAPPLYALTKRINPTRYDSLIDVVVRPSAQKQGRLCADLRRAQPKLIVHYADLSYGFGNVDFEWRRAAAELQKCIEESYKLTGVFGGYAVYRPREVDRG